MSISGQVIKEKAKFFIKKTWNASDGKINKLKKRFGIQLLSTIGENIFPTLCPLNLTRKNLSRL